MLNRVQIVGKRIIEKVFKVDNIEKLEAQEEKMTAVLNTSKEQLNQLKAEIDVSQREIDTKKNENEQLIRLCKNKRDTISDEEMKNIYRLYERQESEIKNKETALVLTKKLLEQCETQVETYTDRIGEITKNISIMKVKNDYTENVKKFKNVAKDLKVKDAKDLEREIEVDFAAAEYELEDMKAEDMTIEKVLNKANEQNGFKDFMKKINE